MKLYCVKCSNGSFVNLSLENKLFRTPSTDFGEVWSDPERARFIAEEAANHWPGETFIAMPLSMIMSK